MTLHIAPDLELPDDVVTQSIAILARRGAGKTYTGSVLVEEVVRASLPVVVLDPTGAWWGLRSSVDGQKPGLPVVIFGGDHADVPLEPTAGKVIADVVVDHPGAYIVDLSAFTSKAAEQRFAGDFLERLYRAKTRESGPLLVVVDEADVFAPQRPGPEQTRTLGALESIVRRGRIKGLGDLLITQRAAVLNKNVLTQTEVLVVMQTTGPQDRAAIDAWIEGNGTKEERAEVLGSLASLERGEAWVWSPSFLRILQRVRIRARTTFDSSRTPEAGETAVTPRAFAPVDLAALGERIAATVEQQKANDPAELRKRIVDLERGNLLMAETIKAGPQTIGQVGELRQLLDELREIGTGMIFAGTGLAGVADNITAAIGRVQGYPHGGGQVERAPRGVPEGGRKAPASGSGRGDPAVATLAPAAPGRAPVPVVSGEGEKPLTAYGRRLLDALARHSPLALSRTQLGLLSGSSRRSSSFDGAIAEIRRRGLALLTGDTYQLTGAGWDEVGGAPLEPQSAGELRAVWRAALPKAEAALFDVLIAAYPDGVSRADLSERSGYSFTSSTFQAAIPSLKKAGLVDEDGGTLRASATLFLGQR